MDFPKPPGLITGPEAIDRAGEWHNYFVDWIFQDADATGHRRGSPEYMNAMIGTLATQNLINSTERSYLEQYCARLGDHYDNATFRWERGDAYIGHLLDDIRTIHDTASGNVDATGVVFRTISNIALGSAVYWKDGGHANVDPAMISLGGLIVGDVMGAIVGFIGAHGTGQNGAGVVASTIYHAAWGSAMAAFIGVMKGM